MSVQRFSTVVFVTVMGSCALVQGESPQLTSDTRPASEGKLVPYKQLDRPKLIAVFPGDQAADVAPITEVRLRFDRPMDPLALNLTWKEGRFFECGRPQYLPDRNEFVIPVQLAAGCRHRIVLNGEHFGGSPRGFMSAEEVAVHTCDWSFATKGVPEPADSSAPKVVSIDPAPGSKVSRVVVLRIRFDRPMSPVHWGLKRSDLSAGLREQPRLSPLVAYDTGLHEFTIPVVLPADWRGSIELEGFESKCGCSAGPVAVQYSTGRKVFSKTLLDRFEHEAGSTGLREVIGKAREVRADLKSLSETVQCLDLRCEPWTSRGFTTISGQWARFKMQGDRQFYGDITHIIHAEAPFIIGSDGRECWFYSGRPGNDGGWMPTLTTCRFEAIAEKNLSFCDPFGSKGPSSLDAMIKDRRLEYVGTKTLDGRTYHVVQSWTAQEIGSAKPDIWLTIDQWWIDADTYWPLQIVSFHHGGRMTKHFRYDRINEAMPTAEFLPGAPAEVVRSDPELLGKGYASRFLSVIDGSSGRMSVRWGKTGSKGTSSSGLN